MKRTVIAAVSVCAVFVGGCKKGVDVEDPIPVDDTPVQHSDIAPRPPKGCGGAVMGIHYGDAYKTLREAEEYKPGLRDYYVRELNDRRNEYLLSGISPSFRKDWMSSHRWSEKDQACLNPLFDEISAAAKRTLPKYQPRGFVHHEEEGLIRDAVKQEYPDVDVMRTGLKTADWAIEKLGNGIPSNRYKYGMAWVKSSKFDDGYCRIVYVNLVQDYAGGGNYAESKAVSISLEPAGCK
jgi:hypothetical protein